MPSASGAGWRCCLGLGKLPGAQPELGRMELESRGGEVLCSS